MYNGATYRDGGTTLEEILKALERDATVTLTPQQRKDVEVIQHNLRLIRNIEQKIVGYPSAREYYVQKLYQGIGSMASARTRKTSSTSFLTSIGPLLAAKCRP